jgi:hypothetical protein
MTFIPLADKNSARRNSGAATSSDFSFPMSATFLKGNFMGAIKPHWQDNDKAEIRQGQFKF